MGTGLLAEHPRGRLGQGDHTGQGALPHPADGHRWLLPKGAPGKISEESPAGSKISQKVHGFWEIKGPAPSSAHQVRAFLSGNQLPRKGRKRLYHPRGKSRFTQSAPPPARPWGHRSRGALAPLLCISVPCWVYPIHIPRREDPKH